MIKTYLGTRRGSDCQSLEQDIIADVAQNEPEPTRGENADAKQGESFSLFVTRILDQLSLTSWLPAITLICNLALILQLRSQHSYDIGRAITSLTAKPLGTLVVLLLSILLASIVTQAFEFESIRLLEGYWGSSRLLSSLSRIRTNRHVERLARLDKRHFADSRQAFNEARDKMLDNKVDREIVEILDKQHRGHPHDDHDPARVAEAEHMGWRRYASPDILRRMDATESLIAQYPEPHRIMPTRLGNTLRSSEDRLDLEADEVLEDYVYNRYPLISPELKAKHDQFRSRLNIYCLLTFISSGLAIVSPIALVNGRANLSGGLVFTVVYAILALVSYQAATASARGYVGVLRVVSSRASSDRRS
jgi:hypothetical protein